MGADRFRYSSPSGAPGFLIWHAALGWKATMGKVLSPLGLTATQWTILVSLDWLIVSREEKPTQREVADQAGADPMMTSQVIRTLEKRGLVERSVDPEDARARRLSITEEGSRLAREGVRVVVEAEAAYFARIGDLEEFVGGLRKLVDSSRRPNTAARNTDVEASRKESA